MTEETQHTANQGDNTQNTITPEQYQTLQAEVERLRKHSETLLAEKKAESEQRKAEQTEKDRLAEEAEREIARKKGDFETLEKQYQAKIQELQNQIAERDAQRDTDLVKSQAQKLASSLSDNPANQEILQMILEKRLSAKNGQISVLDDGGAVSIANIDDLKREIETCGKYDSLVVGTRASGTGSNGKPAIKQASEYSEQERIELATTNPTLFNQLFME